MKNSTKKNITKTIYFTDINNVELLGSTIKDGCVFDRKKIIPSKIGVNKNVFNFFNNTHLEQEFINLLKNKKTTNIIYRLYYNDPSIVVNNIRNILSKSKNNKSMDVVFKYVVSNSDYEHDSKITNAYDDIIVVDI